MDINQFNDDILTASNQLTNAGKKSVRRLILWTDQIFISDVSSCSFGLILC
jgi:hypothetical protein